MVQPVWGGCITANDPEWLAWHQRTGTALLSWSSQARGFFVVGDPGYTADKELARAWYSPDNFARLERAKELAKKKNVAPLQINLAWVLSQKFPTFALIGPRAIEETRSTMEGLSVKLTPEEVTWLLNG
jgi:aryl-alcohol dehydrogenase-like predicted oxidoreductase